MRKYEFLGILDPSLTDSERTALLSDITRELTAGGANITLTDEWGVREMAYRIHGSWQGYYVRYELELSQGDFFAATKAINLKKALWRHMIVRIED